VIECRNGVYHLVCDLCGQEANSLEPFSRFEQAVEYKKKDGWRSEKRSADEWEDICPECQEEGEGSHCWD